MPLVGEELAGYRLLSVLGRGGMSVVYQAENPRLSSVIALKVLAPELATNDLFRARFLHESRIAASLSHPNVVPIFDMGTHEDLLYIAMRYVPGSDLRALLRAHHRLLPAQSLYLVGQAGRALDFAHQRGLVHRDVKPANVLVERGVDEEDPDHAYLADFGITKHALSKSGLTPTGQFVGTLDYIAPEQIQGPTVDRRADIYSLGCVLYECLTGQVPFVKDVDAAVIWAHVEEDAPPPSSLRTGLPVEIDEVIGRALAKRPDDRYATCRDMMAAARAAFEDPDLTRVRVLSRVTGEVAGRPPQATDVRSGASPVTDAGVIGGVGEVSAAVPETAEPSAAEGGADQIGGPSAVPGLAGDDQPALGPSAPEAGFAAAAAPSAAPAQSPSVGDEDLTRNRALGAPVPVAGAEIPGSDTVAPSGPGAADGVGAAEGVGVPSGPGGPGSSGGLAGPDQLGGSAPRPRNRGTALAGAAAAIVLFVVAGLWVGSHLFRGSDAKSPSAAGPGSSSASMSMPPSPPASAGEDSGALMTAVRKANRGTHGLLPPSKCMQLSDTHVRCTNPHNGASRVDFTTYPNLQVLYRQYKATIQHLTGESFRANFRDCGLHSTNGEVSWNHDYEHSKKYSVAQVRDGMASDEDAAGRVFCIYTEGYQYFVWTDDDGRMLGVVAGYPHTSTWPWWHDVHHDMAVHGMPPM